MTLTIEDASRLGALDGEQFARIAISQTYFGGDGRIVSLCPSGLAEELVKRGAPNAREFSSQASTDAWRATLVANGGGASATAFTLAYGEAAARFLDEFCVEYQLRLSPPVNRAARRASLSDLRRK